jgi:hypothetical protein
VGTSFDAGRLVQLSTTETSHFVTATGSSPD